MLLRSYIYLFIYFTHLKKTGIHVITSLEEQAGWDFGKEGAGGNLWPSKCLTILRESENTSACAITFSHIIAALFL